MSEKNTKTKYTATLTLTQEGLDGDVFSSLKFDPLMTPDDINEDGTIDVPDVYELISFAAEALLKEMGILNEKGELVEEDELHSTVNIDASTLVSRKLN